MTLWTIESLREILEHGAEQQPLLCTECRKYHVDAYKYSFELVYTRAYATPESFTWNADDTICVIQFPQRTITLKFDFSFRFVGNDLHTHEELMGQITAITDNYF